MRSYEIAPESAVKRARQLRRASTDAEKRLWRALRSKLPQYKWRRQMPVGPYFADFACFAQKLIVELDGGQHAAAVEYDTARTQFLEARGYRVVRFWNNDVLSNSDGVLQKIGESLSSLTPSRLCRSDPLPSGEGGMALGATVRGRSDPLPSGEGGMARSARRVRA